MVLARRTAPNGARTQQILIVKDDASLRASMTRLLRGSGYAPHCAADDVELQHMLSTRPIDMILLSAVLPTTDALSMCRSIRAHSNVPIIMISAESEEADRVAALNHGADDYVTKPIGRSELLARIGALLRRAASHYAAPAYPSFEQFSFAGWHYHARRRELRSPTDTEIILTTAEHELLLSLLRHAQQPIGRERLLEMSRSRVADASDRSVDMLVSRLRRKLGDGPEGRTMIRTIRGTGYMFSLDVRVS